MIDVTARNDREAFRAAIDAVAKRLVVTHHRTGMSMIKTPVLFPSGTSIVVHVADSFPRFFVTDYGAGYEEAELMGGASIYSRSANAIAKRYGVGFDDHSFFVAEATDGQLAGAIAAVANCAQQAVTITTYRLAERRSADDAEDLYHRLVDVFHREYVAKDVPIIGQSSTEWRVAAAVVHRDQKTLFEPVSSHHSSVFANSTKFHDIEGLELAPGRVAVVHKKAELGTYFAVLSQVATVIERDASNDVYRRLALAA